MKKGNDSTAAQFSVGSKRLAHGSAWRTLNSCSQQWDKVNNIKYNGGVKLNGSIFFEIEQLTETHKERRHVRKKDAEYK